MIKSGKCPHQELHLEPQPLEAARASLLHLADMMKKGVRRHGNAPCRSGDSWVTARLVSLTNYRRMKGTQGLELHQPSAAYETTLSTGSPCND